MKNMFHRAVEHMEKEPARVHTLTELRKAAGITMRSQYRLSQQLLASGMVERAAGGYRFNDYLQAR
jgi:DNA-binding IclR family transcriptional regulator